MLSENEIERYQRHLVLKGVGGPGQNRLKSARVLIVGVGGLGSPVLQYLAAAGVGFITICDGDRVSLSNLQRQTIHGSDDIGTHKVTSAANFVRQLNPHVTIATIADELDDLDFAKSAIGSHDVVLDCTDQFASRALVAQAAQETKTALVSGAVNMFDGQVTVFAPHLANDEGQHYPRFSDLYPSAPPQGSLPSCEQVGILGAVTGVIGTLMAMEAIKLITGVGAPLIGRMMMYDGRAAQFREIRYKRHKDKT